MQKSSVYAIDRDNGQLRWRYETTVKFVRVLFVGERVFALDADCKVHCLQASDGAALRVVSAGPSSGWGASMLAHDGLLYVATSDGVVALGVNGDVVWRFKSPDPGTDGVLPGLALPSQVAQLDRVE